jgi:hypothetical protein
MPAYLGIGTAAGWSPEKDMTWHTLFYASGAEFRAQGYADGDDLTAVQDEFGADADNAVPAYVNANQEFRIGDAGVLGGHGHFWFADGGPATLAPTGAAPLDTGTWAKSTTSGTYTAVMIWDSADWSIRDQALFYDSATIATLNCRTVSDGRMVVGNKFVTGLGAGVDDVHTLLLYTATGSATGYLNFDGVQRMASTDFGMSAPNGLRLCASSSGGSQFYGGLALFGIYDGAMSAGDQTLLSDWSLDRYGVAISP